MRNNSSSAQFGWLTPDTPLPPSPTLTPEDREAFRAHTRRAEQRRTEITDPPDVGAPSPGGEDSAPTTAPGSHTP